MGIEQVERDYAALTKVNEKTDSLSQKTSIDKVIFRGYLLDNEGKPLTGGAILIIEENRGKVTDSSGFYSFDLTYLLPKRDSLTVEYYYTGFLTQRKTIYLSGLNKDINITLDNRLELIEFYVTRAPLHKRFWRKITRPFRRRK